MISSAVCAPVRLNNRKPWSGARDLGRRLAQGEKLGPDEAGPVSSLNAVVNDQWPVVRYNFGGHQAAL